MKTWDEEELKWSGGFAWMYSSVLWTRWSKLYVAWRNQRLSYPIPIPHHSYCSNILKPNEGGRDKAVDEMPFIQEINRFWKYAGTYRSIQIDVIKVPHLMNRGIESGGIWHHNTYDPSPFRIAKSCFNFLYAHPFELRQFLQQNQSLQYRPFNFN